MTYWQRCQEIVAERTAQHVGDDREISKRLTNSQTVLQAKAQWENKRTRTAPTNTNSEGEKENLQIFLLFDDNRDLGRMGKWNHIKCHENVKNSSLTGIETSLIYTLC